MSFLIASAACKKPDQPVQNSLPKGKVKVLTGCQKFALTSDIALAAIAIVTGVLALLAIHGVPLSFLSGISTVGVKYAWIMIGVGGGVIILDLIRYAFMSCKAHKPDSFDQLIEDMTNDLSPNKQPQGGDSSIVPHQSEEEEENNSSMGGGNSVEDMNNINNGNQNSNAPLQLNAINQQVLNGDIKLEPEPEEESSEEEQPIIPVQNTNQQSDPSNNLEPTITIENNNYILPPPKVEEGQEYKNPVFRPLVLKKRKELSSNAPPSSQDRSWQDELAAKLKKRKNDEQVFESNENRKNEEAKETPSITPVTNWISANGEAPPPPPLPSESKEEKPKKQTISEAPPLKKPTTIVKALDQNDLKANILNRNLKSVPIEKKVNPSLAKENPFKNVLRSSTQQTNNNNNEAPPRKEAPKKIGSVAKKQPAKKGVLKGNVLKAPQKQPTNNQGGNTSLKTNASPVTVTQPIIKKEETPVQTQDIENNVVASNLVDNKQTNESPKNKASNSFFIETEENHDIDGEEEAKRRNAMVQQLKANAAQSSIEQNVVSDANTYALPPPPPIFDNKEEPIVEVNQPVEVVFQEAPVAPPPPQVNLVEDNDIKPIRLTLTEQLKVQKDNMVKDFPPMSEGVIKLVKTLLHEKNHQLIEQDINAFKNYLNHKSIENKNEKKEITKHFLMETSALQKALKLHAQKVEEDRDDWGDETDIVAVIPTKLEDESPVNSLFTFIDTDAPKPFTEYFTQIQKWINSAENSRQKSLRAMAAINVFAAKMKELIEGGSKNAKSESKIERIEPQDLILRKEKSEEDLELFISQGVELELAVEVELNGQDYNLNELVWDNVTEEQKKEIKDILQIKKSGIQCASEEVFTRLTVLHRLVTQMVKDLNDRYEKEDLTQEIERLKERSKKLKTYLDKIAESKDGKAIIAKLFPEKK